MKKEKNNPKNNQKINDLLALCQRVQADFENYKKRAQKEREEFSKYSNIDLILQILPVIDNFKLATKHLPKELEENNWAKGVLQIEKQLEQVLTSEGLEEISSDDDFNPHEHDAVEEVASEKPPGKIIETITKGYKINGKIIRPAKVKVSAENKTKEKGRR
ncbi:MAG: nucleotide exchange factor GrpE [Patescibacteria group bacterium]|nr:nucleotide exchange factor GrpE [Patescibacteria group bacterium]